MPTSASFISLFTWPTAFKTPLPIKRLSPSRSSNASRLPVLAPEGTIALSTVPSLNSTVAFTVGLPKGEFKNNINDTGFGITGKIGVGFEDMPLMIGAELTYLNYGDETRTVPFSLTIPDV